jgi:peptidoglycan/LPS O-acetylase OafA/YrhL
MLSPSPATTVSDSSLPAAVQRRHISGLALLRGLAALSVGLYHYTGAVLPKLNVPEIQAIFKNGWLGVEVFFVISGFVIPYSLLGKNYSPRKFFPYIAKRIVRINPPAYLAMLLVLAQWYLIDYALSHHISYTKDVTASRLVNNILFTVPFSEQGWVIGIFWTLAIEFQFYLFIGLFFPLMFEKKQLIWFLVLFVLANLIQHLPFKSSENFFHFSSLFALGGLTLFRHQERISNPLYFALLIAFTGLAYFEIGLYQAAIGLLTALAIYYVKIENRFTRFLGDISFSFYLVHAVIGTTCEFILIKFIPVGPVINRIGLLVLCLGVAIVGSYLFYLVVERPFMRLASRLRV